jgi:hypothetical protein
MLTSIKPAGMTGQELWSCRLLWFILFVSLMPIAIAARLTGWRWQPWSPGPNGYRSCIREADSRANICVGITYSAY